MHVAETLQLLHLIYKYEYTYTYSTSTYKYKNQFFMKVEGSC